MSNKGCRALWIRLQIEDYRFIRLPFPIPLYIFEELLDVVLDLLSLVCFVVPKKPVGADASRLSVPLVKALVGDCLRLLQSLNDEAPYDLVDVTTDKVKVLIKVR